MIRQTDSEAADSGLCSGETVQCALSALSDAADRLCRQQFGDGVFIRGIVEFSNVCARDCLYCGIRGSRCDIDRYVMKPEEVLAAVSAGYAAGLRSFVLQSGEASVYSVDDFCRLVEAIHTMCGDPVAVTLSVGERSRSEYRRLFDAGADRFLMRFESANPRVYARNHPGCRLEDRFEALATLKEIGYETGTGFLIGIPYEEPDDFERNLETLIAFRPHMAGLGPFIPAEGTPAAAFAPGSFDKVLEAYSRIRLALPQINLAAATALDSLVPEGRYRALHAGANVYMPNLTPALFRSRYRLYARKTAADAFDGWKHQLETELAAFGRRPLWNEIGTSLLLKGESGVRRRKSGNGMRKGDLRQ